MSSFTSSSNHVRFLWPEAKVLLFVGLVLAMGEVGLRVMLGRLSVDMRHLQEIPRVADAIRRDHSKTVLFLGNSLTRRGVNLDVIRRSLGEDVHAYAIYPDDTTLLDWHYTFERYFVDTGSKPDIVVIGYAHVMLNDGAPSHPERIARYAGLKYAPELFANDLPGAGPKVDYLLSAASVTFAEGSRVRLMLLDRLIPGYRNTAQLLNTTALHGLERRSSSGSLGRLSRFLAMCRANRVQPVFVAMPVSEPYSVDPRLPVAIAEGGGVFVDMRKVEGIDKSRYLDGLHLDPRGAVLYSSALAPRLAVMLHQPAAGTVPAAREQTPPQQVARRLRSPS